MSARPRPTRAQWAKTDEQVALRLAALDARLEHLKPPSLADIDTHLAAHPLPDDGYVRTIDRDRWAIWMRLSGQCRARRARLCKEQAQLEHVRDYRAVQVFTDSPLGVDDPDYAHGVQGALPEVTTDGPELAIPRAPANIADTQAIEAGTREL